MDQHEPDDESFFFPTTAVPRLGIRQVSQRVVLMYSFNQRSDWQVPPAFLWVFFSW